MFNHLRTEKSLPYIAVTLGLPETETQVTPGQ